MMHQVTLDLTGCSSLYDLHMRIKQTFGFPDFYGMNLSALWDCLRDYYPENAVVCIKGTATLPKRKTFQEYMKNIFEIFSDVEDEAGNVTFEVVS